MTDQLLPAVGPGTETNPAVAKPKDQPAQTRRRAIFAGLDANEEPTEEWMLSYSDMVTLLLTMFIALLLNADFTKTVRGGDAGGGGGRALHGAAHPGDGGGENGVDRTGHAGEGHGLGAGGEGNGHAGRAGMRDTLQEWFHVNVISPYADENGSVVAIRAPLGAKNIPQDADLAVVKDRDLAQIAFREHTLASIREKLIQAHIEQYVTADIEGDGIRLDVPNAILFGTGSADFASEGAAVIRAITPIVAADTFTISVEGHTDNIPIKTERFPSNWELSAQRAASIVRLMDEAGIEPSRLQAVGLADTQPRATNETVEGRAQNRRVALFLRF